MMHGLPGGSATDQQKAGTRQNEDLRSFHGMKMMRPRTSVEQAQFARPRRGAGIAAKCEFHFGYLNHFLAAILRTNQVTHFFPVSSLGIATVVRLPLHGLAQTGAIIALIQLSAKVMQVIRLGANARLNGGRRCGVGLL